MTKGTEINNIIKALSKMMFRLTKEFLKFNFKQEDVIRVITSSVAVKFNGKGLRIYNLWSLGIDAAAIVSVKNTLLKKKISFSELL